MGAHTPVSGAILAGGRARRFGGRDKATLLVGGRRILDRQLDVLARFTDDLLIVGGTARPGVPAGVRRVDDRVAGTGPLGGLCTALAGASAPVVIILACDLPFVTVPLVAALLDTLAEGEADVSLPRDARGLHPLCACYRTHLLPQLERQLQQGQRKVVDALADARLAVLEGERLAAVDPDGRALTNVNTAEDYAAVLALIGPDRR